MGIEVGLVPGKTWVNVIPNEPGLVGNSFILNNTHEIKGE